MASIQNDRDVLLQAAVTRVLPVPIDPALIPGLVDTIAAVKGIKLSAPSTVFAVPATGVTTPVSIVVNAKLTLITGTVTWDIYSGAGTIYPAGLNCTLIPSMITSPSITLRAQVTFEGTTYTDYWTVAMVKDGLEGEMRGLTIYSNANAFSRTGVGSATTPSTITLTAQMMGGLTGTVSWAVEAGAATLTPSGATCVVTGSSVTGYSVTVRAQVTSAGVTYQARYTLSKFGVLSAADKVALDTQVTGQLSNGQVNGLGALAILNTVDLNTQTVGALNGATQVTNLGTLAYANAIAANQIGAGTLAVGVAYAGTVNATQVNAGSFSGKEFTGGTFTGGTIRTAVSGSRVEVSGGSVLGYRSSGASGFVLTNSGNLTLYGESLVDLPPLAINPTDNDGHIYLTPKDQATFPAKRDGLIFWHDTWKLCICDGVNWYTVDATILSGV